MKFFRKFVRLHLHFLFIRMKGACHMKDSQIIELYFARNESAIRETDRKYGRYCHYIAYCILADDLDSEEIVNDTYLKTWNTVPPNTPDPLKGYVGMISNQLALNRYEEKHAQKRGGGEVPLALHELSECVSGEESDIAGELALYDALNRFLATLPVKARRIFVRRYWYLSPSAEIAREYGISENSVNVTLSRTREKLGAFLKKEGFPI